MCSSDLSASRQARPAHGAVPDVKREPLRVLALPAGTRCTGAIRHRIGEADDWQLALLVLGLRAIGQIGMGYGLGWGLCRVELRGVALNALSRAIRVRAG